jgi:hypothetical protein
MQACDEHEQSEPSHGLKQPNRSLEHPMRTLVLSVLLLVVVSARADDKPAFTPLFNGTTLAGWKQIGGKEGVWAVEDGMIVSKSGGGGWLSTEKTYADFIVRLEYRMKPGGNSGVFLRAPHEGNPWVAGMEIQLLDDPHPKYKSIKEWQHSGSIYGVVPPKKVAIKPAGEWNQVEIRAQGPKITVIFNGETVVDADLTQHKNAEKEHPGIARKSGYLGLQSHDERVEFRKVEVKELK